MTAMAAESALPAVEKLQARLAANPDPKKVSRGPRGRGGRWAGRDPVTVAAGAGASDPEPNSSPQPRGSSEVPRGSPLLSSSGSGPAEPGRSGRALRALPELAPELDGRGDPAPPPPRAWRGRCAPGSDTGVLLRPREPGCRPGVAGRPGSPSRPPVPLARASRASSRAAGAARKLESSGGMGKGRAGSRLGNAESCPSGSLSFSLSPWRPGATSPCLAGANARGRVQLPSASRSFKCRLPPRLASRPGARVPGMPEWLGKVCGSVSARRAAPERFLKCCCKRK